jgi:hypothetical protein
MASQQELFGKWDIVAQFTPVDKSFINASRFTITGSDDRDGHYPVDPGPVTLRSVKGSSWTISMDGGLSIPEPGGNEYIPLSISRAAEVAAHGALIITLTGSGPPRLSESFATLLVLTCTNLDPDLNPLPIEGKPIAFTFRKP